MLFIRRAIAALAILLIFVAAASSQPSYPDRLIKIVVPYPPGGVVDITGRLLADRLQNELKVPIIVENKSGGGGLIGANYVAKSSPDGYTILLSGAATHAFAPAMYKTIPYDPVTDFMPITQVTEGYLALTVAADSNIKDLAGFIRLMKEKGGSSNYASNGIGTYPHLAMELLKQTADFQLTHVPYRGGAESVIALLAGEVQVTFNHLPVVLSHIKAGKLRALVTSGSSRSPVLPDVPTLKESGYDVVAAAWFGLFAPAKTPHAIVEKISAAVSRAMQDPGIIEKLRAQGDEVRVEGPDSFMALEKSELTKWKLVIEKAGIVPN